MAYNHVRKGLVKAPPLIASQQSAEAGRWYKEAFPLIEFLVLSPTSLCFFERRLSLRHETFPDFSSQSVNFCTFVYCIFVY